VGLVSSVNLNHPYGAVDVVISRFVDLPSRSFEMAGPLPEDFGKVLIKTAAP